MYQKLLVEKEQRLRDFMTLNQGENSSYQGIISSRSWRLVMALNRLKYRLRRLF
jgi:hypothetical protein